MDVNIKCDKEDCVGCLLVDHCHNRKIHSSKWPLKNEYLLMDDIVYGFNLVIGNIPY